MQDWALILGSSSGFGAATCKKLALKGINIYGIHLDRKVAMDNVNNLIKDLNSTGVEVIFKNISATDENKRKNIIKDLVALGDLRIKIVLHSLAFGSLKAIINDDQSSVLKQKQIEMTSDVMANSIIYWVQDLFYANLIKKGSQIFAMTSSGGHRQWEKYGAVSAAKASLESFCRQLAFEFSKYGIGVNAIQAGVTDTPALRKIPNYEKMIKHAKNINPANRLTLPKDVANIIALLGLSEETWLTGNTIRVDGGEDITG